MTRIKPKKPQLFCGDYDEYNDPNDFLYSHSPTLDENENETLIEKSLMKITILLLLYRNQMIVKKK